MEAEEEVVVRFIYLSAHEELVLGRVLARKGTT